MNHTPTDSRRYRTADSRAAVAVSCSRLSGCEAMWPGICITGRFLGDPCSTLLGIVFIWCVSPVEMRESAEMKNGEAASDRNRQRSVRWPEKQLSQTQSGEQPYSRQTAHFGFLSLTCSLDHVGFLTRASRRPICMSSVQIALASPRLASLVSETSGVGQHPGCQIAPNSLLFEMCH